MLLWHGQLEHRTSDLFDYCKAVMSLFHHSCTIKLPTLCRFVRCLVIFLPFYLVPGVVGTKDIVRCWINVHGHKNSSLCSCLFLQCLDLNKFVAVHDESHLINRALELLDNETFWAAIVFENLPPNSSQPPPYIKYKIRMDIDEVERTNKAMDR